MKSVGTEFIIKSSEQKDRRSEVKEMMSPWLVLKGCSSWTQASLPRISSRPRDIARKRASQSLRKPNPTDTLVILKDERWKADDRSGVCERLKR